MFKRDDLKLCDPELPQGRPVLVEDGQELVDAPANRLLAGLPANPMFEALIAQRYGADADLIALRLVPEGHCGNFEDEAVRCGLAGVSAALDHLFGKR